MLAWPWQKFKMVDFFQDGRQYEPDFQAMHETTVKIMIES